MNQCAPCFPVFRRHNPTADASDLVTSNFSEQSAFTVVVIGASGDLAKKKLFPSLLKLYHHRLIPSHVHIVGYARSAITHHDFREGIKSKFPANIPPPTVVEFLERVHYIQGEYANPQGYATLAEFLRTLEAGKASANRVFYFSIPPSIFTQVAAAMKPAALSTTGWNRFVIEKPFGRDLESSELLQRDLSALYTEEQLYRIDHYLGKEMVMNLLALRFANSMFEPLWNRNHIKCVVITFKEDIGTEGRGGYFDQFGIIRDVMQNHLLQVLALVAMEPPVSLSAEDIRNEKVKVLQCIPPVPQCNTVIGQYEAYRSETGVPRDSVTPTFAACALCVQNARWAGVPFILKCGKGLNERKAEIRIQLQPPKHYLFEGAIPNEIVIRIQPNEAIYSKLMTKIPGHSGELVQTELDLTYRSRFNENLPDAYEQLIRDVLRGDHSLFVRQDELRVAWSIFTPLLKALETQRVEPIQYKWGTRGPEESDRMLKSMGFEYTSTTYKWPPASGKS
ncbi:glucose-6-phosphate dehydrogenase [Pelomyxa schiedti]|nr:glucose-6-phosphate dehydrogenase [Pelomyxa schiedti]